MKHTSSAKLIRPQSHFLQSKKGIITVRGDSHPCCWHCSGEQRKKRLAELPFITLCSCLKHTMSSLFCMEEKLVFNSSSFYSVRDYGE